MERDFPHNQLYFTARNTPPTTISNKHHPEALIIEKCGPLFKKTADLPAVRFSAVDPDELSTAIQLAKRDIRRKKWEEEMKQTIQGPTKKPKGRGKGVKSLAPRPSQSKDVARLNKKHSSTKHFLFVKNGASSHHVNSKQNQGVNAHDCSTTSIPAAAAPQDPLAKSLSEITRLQGVIKTHLQAMRQMEENAKSELDTKPEKLVFAEDIEEERKRAARAEGQATRLTHMVYMLGQQVQKIKEQTDKNSANLPRTRKSDLLNRAAAAHRSVVKIQQTFLQNMPYFDLHKEGMPKSYYDLAVVIQQLVFCCDALQCEGDVEITSGLLNLVSDIIGMSKNNDKKNLPAVKASNTRQEKVSPTSPVIKEKVAVERDVIPTRPAEKAVLMGSPDRQAVLRAGMDAILRAQKSPITPTKKLSSARTTPKKSPVPPLSLPTTPRTPRSARRDIFSERQEKKGVLIPPAFQQKKVSRPAPMGDAHYAEPTFSSRIKEVPTKSRSRPTSPRRSMSAPASPHHRPRYSQHQFAPASPRGQFGSPRSYRSNASRPTVRIDEGFNQYRSPVSTLDTSLNKLLKNTQKAINANLIADNLMDEVVEDVARNMQKMQEDVEIHDDAVSMQSSSTIENILHRLDEMEGEQDSIRKRWGTIGFEDEYSMPARTAYINTTREEGVLSPVPIIVSNVPGTDENNRGFTMGPIQNHKSSAEGEANPWIFTKPKPSSTARIEYLQSVVKRDREEEENKTVKVRLSRNDISKIHEGRKQFHEHLKRLSHEPVGKFNPLGIMDRIADDIFADCLKEVCRELEDINTEIASHVYSGEFAKIPRGSGKGQN